MSGSTPAEAVELNFESFAYHLFNQSPPPPPNSSIVNIDFEDESSTLDFLQDLFQYGVKFKFPEKKIFTMDDFNFIRDYIRSIGWESVLQAYEKDTETDEITRINLTFNSIVP